MATEDELNEIRKIFAQAKPRSYSRIDMIRFSKMPKGDMPIWLALQLYDTRYPGLSAEEKLNNLKKALNESEE